MTNIITEANQKHYAIAIPFVDEENLLFQVRSDKLNHQPGDICFPGGAVENDETPEEAVIRELTFFICSFCFAARSYWRVKKLR